MILIRNLGQSLNSYATEEAFHIPNRFKQLCKWISKLFTLPVKIFPVTNSIYYSSWII